MHESRGVVSDISGFASQVYLTSSRTVSRSNTRATGFKTKELVEALSIASAAKEQRDAINSKISSLKKREK